MDLKNYNIFISATTLKPFVIYDEVLWIGENFNRPVKTVDDIENVVGKHYFPIPKETIDFWIKEKNATYEWLFPFLLKECYDEVGGFYGETVVEDGGAWNDVYWEPYYKSTLEYSQYKEKIVNCFKAKCQDFINNKFFVKEKYQEGCL